MRDTKRRGKEFKQNLVIQSYDLFQIRKACTHLIYKRGYFIILQFVQIKNTICLALKQIDYVSKRMKIKIEGYMGIDYLNKIRYEYSA